MTKTTFVCLDTNILFRVVTQAQKRNEEADWQKLCEFAKNGECKLIMPEVIMLEFGKLVRTLEYEFAGACDKLNLQLTQAFKKDQIWNEIHDAFDAITENFSNWRKEKFQKMTERADGIKSFLESESVTVVPYTQEIHFSAHRRFVGGTFPKNPKKDNQARNLEDCAVIESLVSYFAGNIDDKQLLFATENYADFGLTVDDEQTVLHPLLTEKLPPLTQVFKNLAKMVEFLNERRPVEKPTPEKVQEAIVRDKELKSARSIAEELNEQAEWKALADTLDEWTSIRQLYPSSIELWSPKLLDRESSLRALGEEIGKSKSWTDEIRKALEISEFIRIATKAKTKHQKTDDPKSDNPDTKQD